MKKGLIVILAGVLAVAMGLGGLSVVNNIRNTRSFMADGYILDPSDEETITTNVDAMYYFTQGSNYKQKFGDQIMFKDTTGTKASLDTNHFIHYNDGSLGSFTKGVVMDISEIDESNYGYYSLTKNTVLIKNGNSYELTSRGESMALSEFVWKISDVDYMLVSPSITLDVGPEEVTFSDYAQITYVDSGIVRISHQTGTYQTVAADSELVTEQGAELNLVGKSFMVDGEPIFSLDDMAIDDDSYIDVDENVDAPTIPTFNVINGKDGASGADGEQGVEGEQGEDGEEGEEGEEGSEGTAGGEGVMGSEGALGQDGVQGVTGLDGNVGEDGKNAETAGGSEITPVELNARPTVTMSSINDDAATGNKYNVTPKSATFTLNMKDYNDTQAFGNGTTEIVIYDRETMTPVKTIKSDNTDGTAEIIEELENGGTKTFTVDGLNPNTEYVMVVSGQYSPDPKNPSDLIKTDYFRKVFTTEGAGIALSKNKVTDSSISANTDITGEVASYTIEYFYKDTSGQEKVVYRKTYGISGTKYEKGTYSEEVNNNMEQRPTDYATEEIKSNTTYYVRYAKVYGGKDYKEVVVENGDAIELTTLKKTPYDKTDETKSILEMVPTLTPNEPDHTFILSLGDIVDPDSGIKGYRYELYKYDRLFDDSGNPISDFSKLEPDFKEESENAINAVFKMPEGSASNYVGRVVAIFDDNETTQNLNTLLTGAESLGAASNNLVVRFRDVGEQEPDHHKIEGYIEIKDVDNKLIKNISNTNPLKLMVTSSYDDILTTTWNDKDALARYYNESSGFYVIPFTQLNLRANTTYALSVVGPLDSDGDNTIQDTEKNTYLVGQRTKTAQIVPGAAASMDASGSAPAMAFARRMVLTNSVDTDSTTVHNQFEAMQYIYLQLIRLSDNAILGDVRLTDKNPLEVDSDFADAFTERTSVFKKESDGSLTCEGLPTTGLKDITLTPVTFGLEAQDQRLSGGGEFEIRIVEAGDYRNQIGGDSLYDLENCNKYVFANGEDKIRFNIDPAHLKALNPNDDVEFEYIRNGDRREENLEDDTIIGLTFKAKYQNNDIDNIYYTIYEVTTNDKTSADIDATSIDRTNGDVRLNPVMSAKKKITGAAASADEVALYFKDTAPAFDCTGYDWVLPDGTSAAGKTVLERGKRYIIRYEIEVRQTAHDAMSCPGGKHAVYPTCAYISGETVPYYRSKVIEVPKELPQVERYLSSSNTTSDVWMYRFKDTDNALITTEDAENKLNLNAIVRSNPVAETVKTQAAERSNTGTPVTFSDIKDTFSPYTITVTTDKNYYVVSLPYRLLSSDQSDSYIDSIPVQFNKYADLTTSADNIQLKGIPAIASAPMAEKYLDGSKYRYKAVVNEGNYRYKITIQGNDVNKYAAFRVTFTSGADSLTYEPVYLSETGMDGAVPYGVAYVEAAPLANWKGKTVTVSVNGYYPITAGFGNSYSSRSDNYPNNMFGESDSIYALRTYKFESPTYTNEYKMMKSNERGIYSIIPTTEGLINSSSFTPISLNVGTKYGDSGAISQNYVISPLAVAAATTTEGQVAAFTNYALDVSFNENGMFAGRKADGTATSQYYVVDKLKLGGSIGYYHDDDKTLTLGDVMPAISEINTSPGANTATMRMQLFGSLATQNAEVYPMVFKQIGKEYYPVEIEQVIETPTGKPAVTYYQVKCNADGTNITYPKDSEASHYAKSDAMKKIPVDQPYNNVYYADLKLRNLEQNGAKYLVKYYTYNGTEITYLYSQDKNTTGYGYIFNTKQMIELDARHSGNLYTKYDDKKITVDYHISGADGDYTRVVYRVFDGDNLVVGPGITDPLGDLGGYYYYSSEWNENPRINIPYSPGSIISSNKSYRIELRIYDTRETPVDLSNLTDDYRGITEFNYTVPTLARPVIDIRRVEVSDGKISVSVYSSDNGRAIIDDTYTVQLLDSSNNIVDSKEITRSPGAYNGDQLHEGIEFTGIGSSSSYKVKVVAEIDLDNNGEVDGEVRQTEDVQYNTSPSAELKLTPTVNSLDINIQRAQNFENVTTAMVSVYGKDKDGKEIFIYTGYCDVNLLEGSANLTYDWRGKVKEGETYTVMIKYQDASGNSLATVPGINITI